jgi:hypothetical protein
MPGSRWKESLEGAGPPPAIPAVAIVIWIPAFAGIDGKMSAWI